MPRMMMKNSYKLINGLFHWYELFIFHMPKKCGRHSATVGAGSRSRYATLELACAGAGKPLRGD
jgi:hypothetical protein